MMLDHLEGIDSAVKSDHILNLFQEVDGVLPKDKESITSSLRTFLAWTPEEQMNFIISNVGPMNRNKCSGTLVADLRHFLNEKGNLIDAPIPSRLLAQYLCSIVEAVATCSLLCLGCLCSINKKGKHESKRSCSTVRPSRTNRPRTFGPNSRGLAAFRVATSSICGSSTCSTVAMSECNHWLHKSAGLTIRPFSSAAMRLYYSIGIKKTGLTALHRTVIPLGSIAAGELSRSLPII